jgi:Putative stress-induced transcription regulator
MGYSVYKLLMNHRPAGTGVNLASYAELAVRLADSVDRGAGTDPLRSSAAFRELIADQSSLGGVVHQQDLDRLKLLRAELAAIFGLSAAGEHGGAVSRLNQLLMIHPILPVLTRHDGEPWHPHLSGSGSAADQYAAGAIFGLSSLISRYGIDRLGNCPVPGCRRFFAAVSDDRSQRYCEEHRIQEILHSLRPAGASAHPGEASRAASRLPGQG